MSKSANTPPSVAEGLAQALDMLTALREVASGHRAQLIADHYSVESAEKASVEALIEMQRMVMRQAVNRGDDE